MQRALVVGSGSIAKRHIKNLRHLFPETEVLCVSSSGRKVAPLEVGACKVANSIEHALEEHLDLAVVASPAPFHLSHAFKLVSADVPVLIEKPLCQDLTELEQQDLDSFCHKIGVGYSLRFMPSASVVRDVIRERTLGAILSVKVECGQYLPDWRPGTDYRESVSAQQKLGGGALLELSHELDYLLWFFGEINSVIAQVENTGALGLDVEDNVNALLKSENELLINLHLDFLQRHPTRIFKAVCEKGNLVWDLLENSVILEVSGTTEHVIYSDLSYNRNEMYLRQIKDFVEFSKGQKEFQSTYQSARKVMKLIAAIRSSSDRNQWVEVPK